MVAPRTGTDMDSSRARRRSRYTGQGHQASTRWADRHAPGTALAPDAVHRSQRDLEAVIAWALVQGGPLPSGPTPTVYGLRMCDPSPATLDLWVDATHAATVLARILPATGVPALRVTARDARGRVTVAGPASGASVTLHLPTDAAARLANEAAASPAPMWARERTADEVAAWDALVARTGPSADRWSRALRRLGLFLGQEADWTSGPPADEQLAGPTPQQAAETRSYSGRDDRRRQSGAHPRGTVVLTARKGGLGQTTIAAAAAAALSLEGTPACLVATAEDLSFAFPSPEVPRSSPEPRTVEIGPGAPPLLLMPVPEDVSASFLRGVRQRADLVLVDLPGHRRTGDLTSRADLTLHLVDDRDVWTRTETTDRRPEWVRCRAWIDDRFSAFDRKQVSDVERLLAALDEEFFYFASDRIDPGPEADEVPSESANRDESSGEESFEDFLERLASAAQFGADADDEDDGKVLPAEDQFPFDQWRADFLDSEDARGVAASWPDAWEHAVDVWPAHHKRRNLARLACDERDPEELAESRRRFVADTDAQGRETWPHLWEGESSAWLASHSGAGEGPVDYAAWHHMIEYRTVPLPAADTAEVLARHSGIAGEATPRRLALLVRQSRGGSQISAEHLADVTAELRAWGVAGLAIVPERRVLAMATRQMRSAADSPEIKAIVDLVRSTLTTN